MAVPRMRDGTGGMVCLMSLYWTEMVNLSFIIMGPSKDIANPEREGYVAK